MDELAPGMQVGRWESKLRRRTPVRGRKQAACVGYPVARHPVRTIRMVCGTISQPADQTCIPRGMVFCLQFGPDGLPSFGGSDEGLPPELRDCAIM